MQKLTKAARLLYDSREMVKATNSDRLAWIVDVVRLFCVACKNYKMDLKSAEDMLQIKDLKDLILSYDKCCRFLEEILHGPSGEKD